MQKRLACWAVSVMLLSAVPAAAQRSTASLRGTVADSTGGVLPGTQVTVTSDATGLTRTTTTNDAGVYSFPDLPVGRYRVQAEIQGFKTAQRTDVILNVADDRAVDFQLETGGVQETVTVESSAQQVKTVGGDVSGLITGEQVRELPLNGRNFLQLATLMPGVSAPDFLNVKDKGLLGGSDLSVSGSAVTANLWTVDGANNNDVGSNRTILVYPSVDAIEEFKILRNSYGPEFGQAGGAQVNIVTRSGTNTFTGSGFYFGRNDALNAKNYFLEQANQPKEELERNDFGGTFGGPIIKDKLHFFGSLEWNREKRGTVRTAAVPSAAEREGDFSATNTECASIPTDPLTGEAFADNKIPSDRLSPGGLLFMKLYPVPNTTPGAGSCNNWVTSITTPINWRQENIRGDYNMSSSSRLMVRYTHDSWQNNAPSLYSNLWGDDPFPAVDSNWDQPGTSFIVQLNQTLGASATNSLQFSYSANKITVTRGGTDPGLNDQINAAIPSVFPNEGREYPTDRGHPVFWGGEGYGEALWNEAPFHNNQDLFVLKDDYSAVFGRHLVKAGALFSFNKKNEDVGGYGSYENSEFWGATGIGGSGDATGNVIADFLLKDMTWGFDENSAQFQVPQRWRDLEFYVADSWKIAPNVTLDYGVRYSYFVNPYAADDRIMSFDPAVFNPALGGDPCNGLLQAPGENWCSEAGFSGGTTGPNRSLYDEDKDNFAPRIGVAWNVGGRGKTAVRAGLGQFFLRERLSGGLALGANPPFRINRNGSRTLDSNVEPCDGCFSDSPGAPSVGREVKGLTPNNWQWNLSVQHEVLRNTTLEVGYVGSKGTHLLNFRDINQVLSGDIDGDGVDDRLEYARSGDGLADVRPYGVFGDSRIIYWDHSGTSTYHSLQTQLVSRFAHASQAQVSYTWSRTIGNVPLDDSGGISADASVLDIQHPELDKGLTRTHRAHIFNAALVLGLPSLENHPGVVHRVFGDWEIASIVAAATGTPLTVFVGQVPGLAGGGVSGTGYTDNQRPNRVAGVDCRASGGPKEQWLNPAAFTLTDFQIGSIGNSGRGICDGPGVFQVDLSFYKNIRITDRVKMQFRFELFNVFNRVNFLTQQLENTMNPTSVTYDTDDPSTATRITSFELPSGFGQAHATRDPRQAQFGFKIMF
jgi:hypothetical protein